MHISEIKVGMRVKWRAGGKVSRLEGVAGKMVTGTVTEVRPGSISGLEVAALPDHRKAEDATFFGMEAAMTADMVQKAE